MEVVKEVKGFKIVSYEMNTKSVKGNFIAAVPKKNKGLAGATLVTEVKGKLETAVKAVESKLK